MIKFINFFFERDVNNLKFEEQMEIAKHKFSKFITYKLFISALGINNLTLAQFIKNKKLKIFSLILILISIKFSYYIYDMNTVPSYYKNKIQTKKYFLCANLFNNTNILDDWTDQMLKLINYVGKDNVYVSIVENGDSTDATRDQLAVFEKVLNQENIPNKIVTEKIYYKNKNDRIGFLAPIRNAALEPIYRDINWNYDEFMIVFFNDIIFKWQDIVKLIMTNDMNYDMTCGMDFYYEFYDTWISRDLDGNRIKKYYPFFRDRNSQNRLINGENIRIYCCWNGVAVLNPEPLFKGVSFRSNAGVMESECFLICKDYWAAGFNRIILNPNIKVAYEYWYYFTAKYVDPVLKIQSYFYYFFSYMFENNPNSSNLDNKNITMRRDWKFYV